MWGKHGQLWVWDEGGLYPPMFHAKPHRDPIWDPLRADGKTMWDQGGQATWDPHSNPRGPTWDPCWCAGWGVISCIKTYRKVYHC